MLITLFIQEKTSKSFLPAIPTTTQSKQIKVLHLSKCKQSKGWGHGGAVAVEAKLISLTKLVLK